MNQWWKTLGKEIIRERRIMITRYRIAYRLNFASSETIECSQRNINSNSSQGFIYRFESAKLYTARLER